MLFIETFPCFQQPFDRFLEPTNMAETVDEKIQNYRTAPFDARFPNTNQTRNCFQNYLGEDIPIFRLGTWKCNIFLIAPLKNELKLKKKKGTIKVINKLHDINTAAYGVSV